MKQYLDRTFLVFGRGFQFSAEPPPGVDDPRNLTSSEPWTVLACALARARHGDLDAVQALPGLMARNHEALVWNGCVQLVGFAGRDQLVFDTAKRFLAQPGDAGVQWYISEMMLNACGLRAVEPLLALHRAAAEPDARRHIQHCLSTLLEEDQGEIDDGPEESQMPDPAYPEELGESVTVVDDEGYTALVRATAAAVADRLQSPEQPVSAGKPLDLQAIVSGLYGRLRSNEPSTPRMEWERMFFEASTGVDCSAFYRKSVLQRLAAMAIVEDFLESGIADRFQVGNRYFFAHPVSP